MPFGPLAGDRFGGTIEAAERLVDERRPAGKHLVTTIWHDQQSTVADLPGETHDLVDRGDRIAITADDQRWGRDLAKVARAEQRLHGNVRGDRREEPPPGVGVGVHGEGRAA